MKNVMTLYMRISILAGEIDMADGYCILIKKEAREMPDGTLKEDSAKMANIDSVSFGGFALCRSALRARMILLAFMF